MKIPLSKHKFAVVDSRDRELVCRYRWHAKQNKSGIWYAVTTDLQTRHKVYLHRLLMGFPSCDVDHRDRDGLNNCRRNLRLATKSQNAANSKTRLGISGRKGVCRHKNTIRWVARIRLGGRKTHLGVFNTQKEAAEAYNAAAVLCFGSFARGS
jgi:hypothetical protein